MAQHRYTVVCEFRGGTYIAQVDAPDEREAARLWAERLAVDRPIPRSSAALAKQVLRDLVDNDPTPLDTLRGVWCIHVLCGGDSMLANIVDSAI